MNEVKRTKVLLNITCIQFFLHVVHSWLMEHTRLTPNLLALSSDALLCITIVWVTVSKVMPDGAKESELAAPRVRRYRATALSRTHTKPCCQASVTSAFRRPEV